MRTTAIQASGKANEGRIRSDSALRKYAPLVSGLVMVTASCLSMSSRGNPPGLPTPQGSASAAPAKSQVQESGKPAQAEVPPAPQRECSASVQKGKVDAFIRNKGAGVEIKVLLPEKGRYMLVSLPPEYVGDMNKAVEGKPDEQADGLTRQAFTLNIGRAFEGSAGKRGRFTFDCVLLTDAVPASPAKKPVVAVEGDEAPAKPVTVAPPAPKATEETKPAPPAPTKSAEPVKPPEQKRRTLNISDSQAQNSKEFIGGTGAQGEPFVVNVLRDRAAKPIMGVSTVDLPIQMVGYFFTFKLTLNQLAKSKIEQTYSEILRIAKETIARAVHGKAQAFPNLPAFKAVVEKAFANNPEIKKYLDAN
jgi:hypothetical protein